MAERKAKSTGDAQGDLVEGIPPTSAEVARVAETHASTEVAILPEFHRPEKLDVATLFSVAMKEADGADKLEKLVGLLHQEEERTARIEFFEALARFQNECPSIPKTGTVKYTTSKGGTFDTTYSTLQDIQRTVDPVLQKHGFSYTWDTEIAGNTIRVVCRLRHYLGHETEASFAGPTENKSSASPIQKVGAAETYCRRRSLLNVVGKAGEDDDQEADLEAMSEPIDFETLERLTARIAELGVNEYRFLQWLGVDKLADLRQANVAAVDEALDKRAATQKAKSEAAPS